jgi:hypothetical protein
LLSYVAKNQLSAQIEKSKNYIQTYVWQASPQTIIQLNGTVVDDASSTVAGKIKNPIQKNRVSIL